MVENFKVFWNVNDNLNISVKITKFLDIFTLTICLSISTMLVSNNTEGGEKNEQMNGWTNEWGWFRQLLQDNAELYHSSSAVRFLNGQIWLPWLWKTSNH
jgi:hypothetical protein